MSDWHSWYMPVTKKAVRMRSDDPRISEARDAYAAECEIDRTARQRAMGLSTDGEGVVCPVCHAWVDGGEDDYLYHRHHACEDPDEREALWQQRGLLRSE